MPTLFYLTAPPPGDVPASSEHTPQKMAQWLLDSPAAIPDLFAQQLRERLTAINEAPPESRTLLAVAETLLPAVWRSLDYLSANIEAETFPLPEKECRFGAALLDIAREFGRLYGALMYGYDSGAIGDKLLGLLSQRLLRCLDQLLLGHYLLHLKTPAWLWRDVHSVYRQALARRKHQERVRDDLAESGYATAEDIYKQILLLAVSDPYSLQSAEILALHRAGERWAASVAFQGAAEPGWYVALLEDRPPWWNDRPTGGEDGKALGLNLQAVVALVATAAERWTHRSGRFEPNVTADGNDTLSAGLLGELHRRWSRPVPAPSPRSGPLHFIIDYKSIHELFGDMVLPSIDTVSHWTATPLSDGMLGYDRDTPGGVRIGLLLAYLAEGDPAVRGLGVISRIVMDRPDGLVKFQIRPLTERAISVGLQPARPAPGTEGVYQRALLYLEEVPESEPRSFLILQSLRQQEISRVRLLAASGMTFVRLANRRNVAFGFVRFDCLHALE